MKRVGRGGLDRGELLPCGGGVGGVRGRSLGPQGGLGHRVGDEIMHFTSNFDADGFQLLRDGRDFFS